MLIPNKIKLTPKVLYRVAKPITFESPARIERLAGLMRHLMLANNGIGLAAPQIGVSRQLFIMDINNTFRICCNPEIVKYSQELVTFKEGCLSFPGESVSIARPAVVEVKYQNANGEWQQATLDKIESICYQHELDHLNGITMHQRQGKEIETTDSK